MNDEQASGNRWEPATPAEPTVEDTAVAPPPGRRRSRRVRLAGLVGAAAALFLGGGAGGYAVGHATGHDQLTPTGFHDGRVGPDDHDGFDGPPPGLSPGQQVPGGSSTSGQDT